MNVAPPLSARLSVRKLHKRYGALEALRGVSFDAEPGEIFGLLGPNGAGKTTTLECVLGLRKPDSGSIFLGELDVAARPSDAKAMIGAQLQSAQLQDKITPREALRLFGEFYPQARAPDELLNEYQLEEKADAAFASLSGGQKQRLFLALAFIHSPPLVILDEPTVGLDPNARRELHAAILRSRNRGCTVVLSTHDLAEAEQLCDRVAIIDQGRIIAADTVNRLLTQSRTVPRVEVTAAKPLPDRFFHTLRGTTAITQSGAFASIATQNVNQTTVEVIGLLQTAHVELLDLHIRRPTLEDIFFEATGRSYPTPHDT